MTSAIRFVLTLPAWLFLVLAGVLLYFGTQHTDKLELEAQKLERAAQAEPPALIDFNASQPIPEGEVALRMNVFDDAAYRFFYADSGPEDYVEYFFFAEEPNAKTTDRKFSAVVVFDSGSADRVAKWWESILIDPEKNTDLADVRGYASPSDILAPETSEALYYVGGQKSENFVYIRPFIDGREAFYVNAIWEIDLIRYAMWLAVAVLLFWAAIRHLIGKHLKKASQPAHTGAKAAVGVASTAVGIAGIGNENCYEDEEDDDFGIAVAIGKTLFGFLWKRRNANTHTAPAALTQSEVEPDIPAAQMSPPVEPEPAIYSPPRQLYSFDGRPIESLDDYDDEEHVIDGQGTGAMA